MGRRAKGPDERTTVLSFRVREAALNAAVEKAGSRENLIGRLRAAVEKFAGAK